ncbi:MAG: single-strand DNA-binding protein [Clostridiales bacterium]|jgi:single-strand DNA-binding protein|nr:ssb [Oscillospiraceae bacterium]MDN5378845.1 single-strand DNA-binding protein [Clostridiales bacterium]
MLNKVILMGRLTADPELRQTANNISTCRFSVAVDRNYAPKGEEKQTDFINVVAWRQTAEFVSKYFSKGSMIVVEGSLRTGSYTDKRYPDVKHYTVDVWADQVYFGESKRSSDNSGASFQPPRHDAPAVQSEENASFAIGNLNEFEEILGDGQLPF